MKRGKVELSLAFLEEFLRGNGLSGYPIIETTAPKDLKIIGVEMDMQQTLNRTSCWIFMESDFFEDVPEGQPIPQIKAFEYTVGEIDPIIIPFTKYPISPKKMKV